MTILQLVDSSTGSLGKQLVTHTNTADRLAALADLLANNVYCILTHVWVARTIGKEQSVEIHICVIVIPRHTDHLNASVDEATDDVCLHTAVNENHLLAGTLIVTDNLLAAHLVNEVYTLVVSLRYVVWFIIKENLTHHHTMFTKHLSQLTGIDACDSWHLFALQPVGKTLHCIPVAILLAVIIHDDGRSINLVTLHEGWQTILLESKWWHTIVAHERECKCHQLTGVRRVGQTLWISHHGCVEHNLARYRSIISKRFAMELGSIAQN